MPKEPPIPADGRCVVCKKKLVPIKRYGAGFEDAFCSTVCCKLYFNVDIPTTAGFGDVKKV